MTIVVTGAAGFTGRHLVKRLRSEGRSEVIGVDCRPDEHLVDIQCDCADREATERMIGETGPDQIYNLAGSITNIYDEAYRSNVVIPKNLLDTLTSRGKKGRLLLIGSSAEYGLVHKDSLPVKEAHPLGAVSMYGLTKVFQTYLMKMYRSLYGTDVVMVRPFNLFGEGISEMLFPGRVERAIADLKAGRVRTIQVGSLDSRRDYMHIDKAVDDYITVMNAGVGGEIYNIGTGASTLLRDLLATLLAGHGLGMDVVEQVERGDRNKMDVPDMYADISKLAALKKGPFFDVGGAEGPERSVKR